MPAPVPIAPPLPFLSRSLFFLVRSAAFLVLCVWALARLLIVPVLALIAFAAGVVCWTAKGLR